MEVQAPDGMQLFGRVLIDVNCLQLNVGYAGQSNGRWHDQQLRRATHLRQLPDEVELYLLEARPGQQRHHLDSPGVRSVGTIAQWGGAAQTGSESVGGLGGVGQDPVKGVEQRVGIVHRRNVPDRSRSRVARATSGRRTSRQ